MKLVYKRPETLKKGPSPYCVGCGYGIIYKLIAEVIDALGIRKKVIVIRSFGCAMGVLESFDLDLIHAAHGRAPAVATGIKRLSPERVVITCQSDGDLISIGTTETIHVAARGEKISIFFINNALYGLTVGQAAPTTLVNQITTTTPGGRDSEDIGFPIRVSELLATLETPAYIARVSIHNPKNVIKTKKAIEKAFQAQIKYKVFSLIEILSSCPTNWHLSPLEALRWVEEKMVPYYPLGEIKKPKGMD